MRLLERDADLDTLDALLAEARAGRGSLVLIGGEAGAGKTSLVRELAARATGSVRLLTGACDALSSPRPLGPLLDLAPDLGEATRRLLSASDHRADLFHAILDDLAAGPPALVTIEDAHWADEATLDLLRYLGRRIDRAGAVLAVTYRDDEVSDRHPLRIVLGDLATAPRVHRIRIDPLSVAAVRVMVDGTALDADAVYRATGGKPFYITEILAAGSGMPATVRDAILTRAARLAPPARATLDALGARPAAMRVAQRLRELGSGSIPRGRRPSTRANPAGLTGREVEVLALLAAGHSNAEIAGRLYLSTKTVEHHVSRVLAKLGCATRHQAAERATALGVVPPT